MRDVALAAGVSPMSVSKVLHGRGVNVRVSEGTAATIRKIALELDYRPNVLARNLRSRSTRTIGLVLETVPDLTGTVRYFAELLDGVTRMAFQNDYSLTLCNSLIGAGPISQMSDGRFDGLLWCRGNYGDDLVQAARSANLPVVIMHQPDRILNPDISCISWDNTGAAKLATEHLIGLGHRKIAFMVPPRSMNNPEACLRKASFFETAAKHGIEAGEADVLNWSDDASEFGYWWKENRQYTAIMSWNESCAIAILGQARLHGVAVPEQLSVLGFDSSSQCDLTQPRLTCVHQPLSEMATRATEILIHRIASQDADPQHFVYPSSLDIRKSTAHPPQV